MDTSEIKQIFKAALHKGNIETAEKLYVHLRNFNHNTLFEELITRYDTPEKSIWFLANKIEPYNIANLHQLAKFGHETFSHLHRLGFNLLGQEQTLLLNLFRQEKFESSKADYLISIGANLRASFIGISDNIVYGSVASSKAKIDYLIQHDIDINYKDRFLLKKAVASNNTEIFDYILCNGGTLDNTDSTLFDYLLFRDDAKMIKFLHGKGLELDVKNNYLIKKAAQHNCPKVVDFLLEIGADISVAQQHATLEVKEVCAKYLFNKINKTVEEKEYDKTSKLKI